MDQFLGNANAAVAMSAKKMGGFMMLRTKLIVVGIVACIMFIGSMIVTSYMDARIKKTTRRGDVEDTTDLDKAYKWGLAASLVYAGLALLSGGIAAALIASLFFAP